MTIRDSIADAAARRNWDYKELAARSGLPRPTVHRYLRGRLDLTGNRLDLLLDALGFEIGPKRRRRRPRSNATPAFLDLVPGVKPLFPYPGSKWDVMPRIIPQMPPHHHYVSVFGGSGADIVRKSPSTLETFNDLDGHVHNVFAVLQDGQKLALLKEMLLTTPAQSHTVFTDAIARLKSGSPVEQAWAFLVISYQGWAVESPSQVKPVRWRHVKYPITTPRRWLSLPDTIEDAATRFRTVQLTNWDWRKLLTKNDSPNTLFFVDPPYWGSESFTLPFPKQEHERLLKSLLKVKGFVILCGHRNRLYDRLLKHWNRQHVGRTKSGKAEHIWTNFDPTGTRLGLNTSPTITAQSTSI